MKDLNNISFYFITDNELTQKSEIDQVIEAIEGGANIIQYRDKKSPKDKIIKIASEIKEICDKNDVIFIVNDYADVASIVDADGLHIGKDDMAYEQARELLKDKIIGVSVNNTQDAIKAEMMGADYLGVGPIFGTMTKKDAGIPIGIEVIAEVKKVVSIPIVAIGGINAHNVDKVIKAGADSVCAISATVIGDITNNVRFFVNKLQEKAIEG